MRIYKASQTVFNWPHLLKEFAPSKVDEVNQAGINLQSLEGFCRLMPASSSLMTSEQYLVHASVTFCYQMHYDGLEYLLRLGLHITAIPKDREDVWGLITGNLLQWRQAYKTCKKLNNFPFYEKMYIFLETFFDSERITYIMRDEE